jgi:hypothetical protein
MDSEMGQGGEINITQSDAKLLISFNLSQAQEVEVSVFNMEGQYIVQSDQINVSNETLSYDLPDGASGLYFLRITRTNTISVSKFFINNN